MQHGALSLCNLLAATSQFSVFIGQKMQLSGCHNVMIMRCVCDMRGHTNFNRVARLSLPILCFGHTMHILNQHYSCLSFLYVRMVNIKLKCNFVETPRVSTELYYNYSFLREIIWLRQAKYSHFLLNKRMTPRFLLN